MNRRLALAASFSAAGVMVAGAVMVGAVLSQGPEPVPQADLAGPVAETGSSVTSQDPIVVYEDQYEFVVTGSASPPAAVAVAEDGDQQALAPAPAPTVAASVAAPAATVAAPATTAPKAVTTTTSRPPGVPKDWPADKPIPPMPANCREPHLEDDGVWNCQH